MSERSARIAEIIGNGGVGVMPTDTIYGLVASACDAAAVARAEALKRGRSGKALIVLITRAQQMRMFCPTLSSELYERAQLLWARRGADYATLVAASKNVSADVSVRRRGISIIVPCRNPRFAYIHKNTGGMAFRMIVPQADASRTRVIYEVMTRVGPVIATSVNHTGDAPAQTVAQCREIFGDACDFYIGPAAPETPAAPSVVVRLSDDGRCDIVRM